MFGGQNDKSLQSINVVNDNRSSQVDESSIGGDRPWEEEKPVEEHVNDMNEYLGGDVSISERNKGDVKRVYLKSLEEKIPYNQMARHNMQIQQYKDLDPSTKMEKFTLSPPKSLAKIIPGTNSPLRSPRARSPLESRNNSELPGGVYFSGIDDITRAS